jgi:hypothetical protein
MKDFIKIGLTGTYISRSWFYWITLSQDRLQEPTFYSKFKPLVLTFRYWFDG